MELSLNDIEVSFGDKKVLKGASFNFVNGKIYALLGRNGAGKTTLFNVIAGENQKSGNVYLDDSIINNNDIGYVLSTPVVPEFLTAREFLKFFCDINQNKIDKDKTIDDYFEMIRIDAEDRDKLLKNYSHGMKSKIQLLVNIISGSKVLLLDEPLTSLDVVMAEEMKNLLKSIKKDRIIIFSTHIMELALTLCDEIVILQDGKLEYIEKSGLSDKEIKNKIIEVLKAEYE